MTDTQKLLADYAKEGSETAFRELTTRYIDLVYSTAVRLVNGDTYLAEDVSQAVFIDLARSAKNLSHEVRLGGWLHRHTCFVAAKVLRGERRRQFRERQAVEMNVQPDHSESHLKQIAPLVDDAINQLNETDRKAVLLRFYEKLDFRAVGQALGSNEAAAQKRVSRALEKLHALLTRRGVTFSVVTLGLALAGGAVNAAPSGLAPHISAGAIASAAATSGSATAFWELIGGTKLKAVSVAALIAASVATPVIMERQAQAKLWVQDESLRRQANQVAAFTTENERLSNKLAPLKTSSVQKNDSRLRELMRLRAEASRLRDRVLGLKMAKFNGRLPAEDQLAELRKFYAKEVVRLKQWFDENPSEKIPELQLISSDDWLDAIQLGPEFKYEGAASLLRANAESSVLSQLFDAMSKFAAQNSGQSPTDLAQLTPYLKAPVDEAILQRYEIAPASSLVPELRPGTNAWVITEKAPVNSELDIRHAYGVTEMRYADERVTNRWTSIH